STSPTRSWINSTPPSPQRRLPRHRPSRTKRKKIRRIRKRTVRGSETLSGSRRGKEADFQNSNIQRPTSREQSNSKTFRIGCWNLGLFWEVGCWNFPPRALLGDPLPRLAFAQPLHRFLEKHLVRFA